MTTKLYAYVGKDGMCRYAGRALNQGDEIWADDSLDAHPLFVPAKAQTITAPVEPVDEEDPDNVDLE